MAYHTTGSRMVPYHSVIELSGGRGGKRPMTLYIFQSELEADAGMLSSFTKSLARHFYISYLTAKNLRQFCL